MEHDGVIVIRSFYAAFKEEDYEAHVRTFLAPNVIWHVAGQNPLAGDFKGADEVLAAMRRFGEQSSHSLELDTRSVFGDTDHVIAVHWATAHRPSFDYAAHEIDVFHVAGNLITEFWSFSEDQAAADALWS